jgi:8-oxo-dGTP pyrophosphatase MutT (NUDIX family)
VTGFRVVASTTRYRASFLEFVDLAVEDPHGAPLTRSVVRHPGAVAVVPLLGDGQVIMVRQWRAAVGRSLLEIPAGKRDVDGEPPDVTGSRELEEEIGRRPGRLTKLAEFYNSPGFCDEHTHLFCATELSGPEARRGVTAEEAELSIETVPLDDTPSLIAAGELQDAKSIIGLLLTRQALELGTIRG